MPTSSRSAAVVAPTPGARARLPVLPAAPRVRPSRTSRWRAGVLIGVHLLIAAHLAHWLTAGTTLTPVEPSEAMELGRSGLVNAGAIFFGAAIVATAIFGRFFCGWGCHLVALQDLCRWLLEKVGIRPRPLGSRALAWVPALAFVYMFLWPALYRMATGGAAPPLQVELTTASFWATFPGWAVALATFATCGFACVYLLGAKGFCSYACPYGAIFGAAERLAPGRIRVTDACSGCGHCTAVCTSNVRVHEEVASHRMVVDPGCMKCMDCVSVCPNDALYFGWGRPALFARPVAPAPKRRPTLGWRDELFLAVAFALAFFALRGLYGIFPFLFSLGLAGCLAYLALVTRRLVRETRFAAKGLLLRDAGRLTRAGWGFTILAVLLAAGLAHSTVVQAHRQIGRWSEAALPPVAPAAPLEGRDLELARRSLAHLERAVTRGLMPQADLAPLFERLGARFAGAGDDADARRAFGGAIAADGPTASRLHDFALAWARSGDPVGAERLFREALRLDPGFQQAREGLGGTLAMQGRFEEAVLELRQAAALAPGDAETRVLLARACAAAGDLAGAREELERARALAPGLLGIDELAAELERASSEAAGLAAP